MNGMKRRMLISTLGAGVVSLTGCLGQGMLNPESTDNQTPRDGSRQVKVTSVGRSPDDTPFEHSVDLVRSEVKAEQTARIRTSIRNTADVPVWNTARIPTFSDFITQPGPQSQQLLLLQPDEGYDAVRPDCWRADLTTDELNHTYSDVVAPIKYTAGETRSKTFEIYGHPENTGPCLTPGEYPVKSLYQVSDNSGIDSTNWEYRWGFTITIEES